MAGGARWPTSGGGGEAAAAGRPGEAGAPAAQAPSPSSIVATKIAAASPARGRNGKGGGGGARDSGCNRANRRSPKGNGSATGRPSGPPSLLSATSVPWGRSARWPNDPPPSRRPFAPAQGGPGAGLSPQPPAASNGLSFRGSSEPWAP